jgi:hypothetical protein
MYVCVSLCFTWKKVFVCVSMCVRERECVCVHKIRMNLSADLYNISPAKIGHLKQVVPFLFFTKTMFPIWGDTVQKFIRVSSDLWCVRLDSSRSN